MVAVLPLTKRTINKLGLHVFILFTDICPLKSNSDNSDNYQNVSSSDNAGIKTTTFLEWNFYSPWSVMLVSLTGSIASQRTQRSDCGAHPDTASEHGSCTVTHAGWLGNLFRHAPCCHYPHPFTPSVVEHKAVSVRLLSSSSPFPLSLRRSGNHPVLNLASTDPEPHLPWTHTNSDTSLCMCKTA